MMARLRSVPGLSWRTLPVALSALALLAAACGDDGQGPASTVTAQATERPAATAAPSRPEAPSPTSPPQEPTASPGQRLVYDPASFTCPGMPAPAIDREWQVSAPRGQPGPVRPAEVVELGLRNKFGAADENYYAGARVIAPDGTSFTGATSVSADAWGYLLYPENFTGGAPLSAGVHTVVWEIDGGFIACDGFVVEPY
ncbi:MAG: hypothetical protein Q7T33_15950 [Dehalococcoidia bacterium]|nr:hypothetical protein [Dehalococcoidia bacterium]